MWWGSWPAEHIFQSVVSGLKLQKCSARKGISTVWVTMLYHVFVIYSINNIMQSSWITPHYSLRNDQRVESTPQVNRPLYDVSKEMVGLSDIDCHAVVPPLCRNECNTMEERQKVFSSNYPHLYNSNKLSKLNNRICCLSTSPRKTHSVVWSHTSISRMA